MLYSFYQKVDDEWVGNHRFSLHQAIASAKLVSEHYRSAVAVVPNNVDPKPYLQLVDSLA